MDMGALPAIAEQAPRNVYHFMLDNGIHAATGGQPVPNVKVILYDVVAQGCLTLGPDGGARPATGPWLA